MARVGEGFKLSWENKRQVRELGGHEAEIVEEQVGSQMDPARREE
jgi:hypothetical protein